MCKHTSSLAELICIYAKDVNNEIKQALNKKGDEAKEHLVKAAGLIYIIQRLESERSSDHPLISTHIIHFIRSEFDETCRTFFLKAMKEAAKTEGVPSGMRTGGFIPKQP